MFPLLQLRIESMRHKNAYRTILVPDTVSFSHILMYQMILFNLTTVKGPIFESVILNGEKGHWGYVQNTSNTIDELEGEELKTWFQQQGDEMHYKYANNSPIVKIILENRIVLPLNENIPTCLNGKGNLFTGKECFIDFQSINDKLKQVYAQSITLTPAQEEADFAGLLKISDRLKKMKPWIEITEEQVISLEITEESTYYVRILGSKQEQFGISISTEPTFEKVDNQMVIQFVNRNDLTKEDYKIIKENGFSFRGKNNWIQFRSYTHGNAPTIPNQQEVKILKSILKILAKVLTQKELNYVQVHHQEKLCYT